MAGRDRQFLGKKLQVAIEERGQILGRLGEAVMSEHLPGDTRVGAAGDLDGREIVLDAKARPKAPAQGTLAGTTGGEERSIDVEEEEFLVQGERMWALLAGWQDRAVGRVLNLTLNRNLNPCRESKIKITIKSKKEQCCLLCRYKGHTPC